MYMYMYIYIYICTHRHGRVRIQEQAISDYHLQNRRMCPEMWDRASVFIGISIGVYPSDNFIFRFIIFFVGCIIRAVHGTPLALKKSLRIVSAKLYDN